MKKQDVPFTFDNQDEVIVSNTDILYKPVKVTISGGLYKVNGGKWRTGNSKVKVGDLITTKGF